MNVRTGSLVVCVAMTTSACAPGLQPAAPSAPHVLLAEATPAPPADATSQPSTAATAATAAAPGAAPAASQAPQSETIDQRQSRHMARNIGWISIGIGAASGVLALGTSYLMLQDKSTRDSDCSSKVCSTQGLTANSQLSDLGPWNAATWIVAAAGLGVGTFLLLTNPSDSSQGTQVGVAPNGSGASLTMRGSF